MQNEESVETSEYNVRNRCPIGYERDTSLLLRMHGSHDGDDVFIIKHVSCSCSDVDDDVGSKTVTGTFKDGSNVQVYHWERDINVSALVV